MPHPHSPSSAAPAPPARRWRRNSALFLGFLSTLVALACIYIVFSSGGLVILDESEGLYECHLTVTLALSPSPTPNQVNTLNPVWDYTMIFRQQGLPVRWGQG